MAMKWRGRLRTGPVVVSLAVAALAALAGCTGPTATAAPQQSPSPSPSVPPPASAAGGACTLLVFEEVAQATGAAFDVAAAGKRGGSTSCVLQRQDADYPDLVLTVTPTKADVAAFRSAVAPKGSAAVTGLGRSGYSVTLRAAGDVGPGVEVGWLARNGRLVVLRYRFPAGTPSAEVAPMTPKLVALARTIDTAGGGASPSPSTSPSSPGSPKPSPR